MSGNVGQYRVSSLGDKAFGTLRVSVEDSSGSGVRTVRSPRIAMSCWPSNWARPASLRVPVICWVSAFSAAWDFLISPRSSKRRVHERDARQSGYYGGGLAL